LAKKAEKKTNAMRELDNVSAQYKTYFWDCPEAISGPEVAEILGLEADSVFKTLVTVGKTGEHYVFMLPVTQELDLKKAANAVGEKAIHMVKSKELLPLTGYIHGGCSPLGMKKQFYTTIDETALLFDTITFSGGRIGCQIQTSVNFLNQAIELNFADITTAAQ
jgi:Cys-tRNA(Pro)/Cys-tRNA(Cys) deacylase